MPVRNVREMLRKWEELPDYMRTEAVRPYYDLLRKRRGALLLKRAFDIVTASLMLAVLSPLLIVISFAIICDSKGGVFFRQERVTQYGRKFKIFKFRTMVADAEKLGTQITVKDDKRVTRIGKALRKYRLDELPQLINIIAGDMSFVGTRPEVEKYVSRYNDEMYATLLLPAGVTSEASIMYKDEEKLLATKDSVDDVYVSKVLPGKMEYNLGSLRGFSFFTEIFTMLKTVISTLKE
ncbi:sugar transferase [Cloacibacillus evryensis]|uniref:sugar transferase n=1 Tax=Cloacibacillus evryensis TaxID=508460 RepID=UPI00210D8897|nr:sugar transferase [Cloacibacillus evryensis]MCQ4764480.1 sugar transferase [Cloacibacillus evryensis]